MASPIEDNWWWADAAGEPRSAPLADLKQALQRERVPPYVLVWKTGWLDWIPAYLLEEFASFQADFGGGARPEADPNQTEPPPVPVEWYVECGGFPEPPPDSEPAARILELDWSEAFSVHESPTIQRQGSRLPVAAFRDLNAYLAHIHRAPLRKRERQDG